MSARNHLVPLIVVGFAALTACSSDDGTLGTTNCPEGTIRAGDTCIDDSGDVVDPGDTGSSDAGTDGTSGTDTATDGATDSGGSGDELLVTEFFGPSGYFGEYCNITEIACPERADGAAGSCIGFTFTPGGECEPGGDAGFGGVWWQNPDGNWGDQPGLPMPPNVNTLTFQAWGAAGGETPTFSAGYESDPVSGSTGEVTLGTEPMRFTIPMNGIGGQELAGGFSWVLDAGGTIYIDDIRYVEQGQTDPDAGDAGDAGGDTATDAGSDAGPSSDEVIVSDFYGPSGYFGEYCNIEAIDCTTRGVDAAGACFGFTFTPSGPCEAGGEEGFAGVYWQYPDGNWGDEPGLPMPPNVDTVTFQAWGATGGESVNFLAGYATDAASGETGQVVLTNAPQTFTISVPAAGGAEIAGGFGWSLGAGATIYVDDIRYIDTSIDDPDAGSDAGSDAGGDTEEPAAPEALPVVVDEWFGPSGYMGEFYAITDTPCDEGIRPDGAVGICHAFLWEPAGNEGWAGVWWQNPDGNWGELPGLPFPEGASAVVFDAWGSVGGEVVAFAAGYADVDPVNGSTGNVTLGTEPTEYRIDFTGAIDQIRGGFSWTAAGRDTDLLFYVDNIRWE